MTTIKYLAVSLTVILFLAGISPTANADNNMATRLTFHLNTSKVAPGDEVVFTGTLRAATGEGLFNMPIRIVEERETESILLITAWTNEDGVYETSWIAKLIQGGKEGTITIFAIFDGRDQYYGSKDHYTGSKSTIAGRLEIHPKLMKVGFYEDRNDYFVGQTAKITILFFDRIDLIDPDKIKAIHNGVTVNITKQREGIYTYTTPPLESKLHNWRIIAEKQGYGPVDRSGVFRVSAVSYDLTAPTSSVLIDGLYNNETKWYYDRFPVATFNAIDHNDVGVPSGVRHIVVQYWDSAGNLCTRNTCSLQPGENMTLSRHNEVDLGRVGVWWFAQDNMGNREVPKKLSIYVDTLPPRLSVLSISTESRENVFTGSNCDKYKNEERYRQCIIVRAFPNESITFRILPNDLKSGVKSVYYRYGNYSAALDTDWQKLETESASFPYDISFKIPRIGAYKLELKVDDIAGNESTVLEYRIFIANPLTEFMLSTTDFNVELHTGKSSLLFRISALLKNSVDNRITADLILLIVNRDGITSHIETRSIQIEPYDEIIFNKSWITEELDTYTIKMFILSKGGIPLGSPSMYTNAGLE